jgi:hypothetical protein
MERETNAPDSSVCPRPIERVETPKPLDDLPPFGRQAVEKVEIDSVGSKALQLLVDEPLEIGLRLHQPDREFRCQVHAVAQAASKQAAEEQLAVPAVIRVRRVEIRDAAGDGRADERFGAFLVDARHVAIDDWQPHAPEAENWNAGVWVFWQRTVLHGRSSRVGC